MIHDGGGAKWMERENKGYREINVYVCVCVFFDAVDECVNNTLQLMYLYKKKDCNNLENKHQHKTVTHTFPIQPER